MFSDSTVIYMTTGAWACVAIIIAIVFGLGVLVGAWISKHGDAHR